MPRVRFSDFGVSIFGGEQGFVPTPVALFPPHMGVGPVLSQCDTESAVAAEPGLSGDAEVPLDGFPYPAF